MKLCKQDGCNRKHLAKGYCKLHYNRVWFRGSPGGNELEQVYSDGRTTHPLYRTYMEMKRRCYNQNFKDYSDYGGRGIAIDERWLGIKGFDKFVEDMGEKPSPKHSIDRIDVDGNYSPENCRWADIYVQTSNRRSNRELVGISKTGSGSWKAELFHKGSYLLQKTFATKLEAIEARTEALNKVRDINNAHTITKNAR